MRHWPLLLLVLVTACAGAGRCPQVGCVSSLAVQVPTEATQVRACVGDVCTDVVREGQVDVPLSRRDDGDTVPLVVELVDAAGTAMTYRADVPVQRTRPNGRTCPPVCVNGSARVDPAAGGIVAPS